MDYKILKNIPDHVRIQNEVTSGLWPEFMFHDPVANANWSTLFDFFPEFQMSLVIDDVVVGVVNCISYFGDRPFEELPERGWD